MLGVLPFLTGCGGGRQASTAASASAPRVVRLCEQAATGIQRAPHVATSLKGNEPAGSGEALRSNAVRELRRAISDGEAVLASTEATISHTARGSESAVAAVALRRLAEHRAGLETVARELTRHPPKSVPEAVAAGWWSRVHEFLLGCGTSQPSTR